MPPRHGPPRTSTSLPASMQKRRPPAAASTSPARSTDQPFTSPHGPSGPRARASKYPPVTTRSRSQRASTSRTSGCASSAASSPRSRRHTSLSGRYGLKVASTNRNQAKTRSSAPAASSPSRTSTATGIPITSSTRRSATAGPLHRRLERLDPRQAGGRGARDDVDVGGPGPQRLLAQDGLRARVERVRVVVAPAQQRRADVDQPPVQHGRLHLDPRVG